MWTSSSWPSLPKRGCTYFLLGLVLVCISLPDVIEARIGVGVGTGKITVTEMLVPGRSYDLPPLTVINTGDEASDYGVGISYHEQQPEHMPSEDWFTYVPERFRLDPGQSQVVTIRLSIPMRAVPGDYFAYIEGHPLISASQETRVNVAAAAKLTFHITTSSIWLAFYHKALSFWEMYQIWIGAVLIFVAGLLVVLGFRRFFKLQIKFKE